MLVWFFKWKFRYDKTYMIFSNSRSSQRGIYLSIGMNVVPPLIKERVSNCDISEFAVFFFNYFNSNTGTSLVGHHQVINNNNNYIFLSTMRSMVWIIKCHGIISGTVFEKIYAVSAMLLPLAADTQRNGRKRF